MVVLEESVNVVCWHVSFYLGFFLKERKNTIFLNYSLILNKLSKYITFAASLEKSEMRIAVVGTGYVGLVTGTCFAETGNQVTCVNIDEKKVESLRAWKITIYKPGLETLFECNIRQERLVFTTSLSRHKRCSNYISCPAYPTGRRRLCRSSIRTVCSRAVRPYARAIHSYHW